MLSIGPQWRWREPPPSSVDDYSTKKVNVREKDDPFSFGKGGSFIIGPLNYRNTLTQEAAGSQKGQNQLKKIDVEGDIVVEYIDGRSHIELSITFKEKLQKPWELSVIMKLFGRQSGYKVLCAWLKSIWLTSKPFHVTDLKNNFLLVKFQVKIDYLDAVIGVLWMILGPCLMVQLWLPFFRATDNKTQKVVTQVRFSNLPLQWYHLKILRTISNIIGKTIKIDYNIHTTQRAKFSLVAIEIDLE